MTTFLSSRGYGLLKEKYTTKQLDKIKEELTVSPNMQMITPNMVVPKFKCFLESNKKIYIPKAYGLKNFGIPDVDNLDEGIEIDVEFTKQLRPNQLEPVNKLLEACNNSITKGGLLELSCGQGKCLGINTPVMMFDGKIKKVQDIEVGDLLMGDDSTPRKVLSLARGREMMYKIIPIKGDPYIVNKSHILSLKCSVNHSKKYYKGAIIDISVENYLDLPKSFHGRAGPLLGYKVGIEFPEKKTNFDPWIIGLWLGDGNSRTTNISTQDSTIYAKLLKDLGKYNLYIKYISQYDYSINSLTNDQKNSLKEELKTQNLLLNKHIPDDYKYNSRENRLKLLAGLIDSDGYYKDNCYEIVQKREILSKDIAYLARSLGFGVTEKTIQKTCTNSTGPNAIDGRVTGTYYKVNFYGKGLEEIPVVCPRKKAHERKQIKDALVSRITVEKLKVDNYYGFEIDGNRRFLLGDCTVTHNTILALYTIAKLKRKTMIIVHKNFLLDQWKERIAEFLPNARVGLIKAKIIDVEDKDIVIASLQSLSMKDYNSQVFKGIGTIVVDEIHRTSSEVFSRAYFKHTPKYSIGLSATMNRADGLSKVFKWHIGDVVFKNITRKDTLDVLCKFYDNDSLLYRREIAMFNGKPLIASMITNICSFEPRNDYIIDIIKEILQKEPNRNILILSDRRAQLESLKNKIELNKLGSVGYYMGGIKQNELDYNARNCPILVGTFSVAACGLDVPKLDTLILVSSKSDVIQATGRILRKKPEDREYTPLVVDIIDNFSIFPNQFKKREKYYRKCKFNIIKENNKTNDDNIEVKLNTYAFKSKTITI